ncbi:hypothetical protein D3C85_286790 [compost metagenome]
MFVSRQATSPTSSAFHSDWRTMCGTRSWRAAPISCATRVLIAIMMPLTVTSTMDQMAAPSDTAASSSGFVWPVIATSAAPMPTVASWPIRMGQASFHSDETSVRMAGRVNEVVCGMGGQLD